MKLWLITQSVNDHYDTYDGAVVAAETAEAARVINPATGDFYDPEVGDQYDAWCEPSHVTVTLLGDAEDSIAHGVVLASFRAG